MLESEFQAKLKKRLEKEFPGCIVKKEDPEQLQGFPDLLILYGDKWACLECKADPKASHRPNQDMWVAKLNGMSYSSFVNPENMEEIIHGLQQAFKS